MRPIEGWLEGVRLVFETPVALWGLVLGLLVLAPLVAGRREWLASTALRAGAVVLVVLAAAGASIEHDVAADRLCVVVAADLSESDAEGAARAAETWTERLAGELGPDDALGSVVFARHAAVGRWPASPPAASREAPPAVDPTATRIAAGIETALPLCDPDSERKLLLVTDGNETVGDARRAAELARQMGVRVYAVVPAAADADAVVIEKLVAPPLVRRGSTFPVRIVVRSIGSGTRRVPLELAIGGETALAEIVEVEPGLNVFEVPRRVEERGTVRVAARLGAADGSPADDRETTLAVTGPIRALVLGAAKSSALARALALKDVEVDFRAPGELPPLEDLLEYHAVILDDVPRKALDDGALDRLETYVERFGGGLVLAGGPRSFGDESYQGSALERVLPVTLVEQKPRPKERKPMGVYLVVDRSNSMTYSGTERDVRDGEKMRYAKQAARALLDQLDDDDHVGVIAFDSEPYVLGPLRPLGDQRSRIEDRVERLLPGGGTDFKEALEIAGAQLAADELRVRHIILLTDGDSNRGAADHMPLVRTLASLGISVTTLRIGLDDVNLEFLREISRMTGGRFYHVRRLNELPQLLVRDAQRADHGGEEAPDRSRGPATRAPSLGVESEVMRGFAEGDFPAVEDPVRSDPKKSADVLLTVPGESGTQPVVATWQVGLGRGAIFAVDPEGPAGELWAGWSGYAKLWSQLVRWAIREETPGETRIAVRHAGERSFLEVETFADEAGDSMAVEILAGDERTISLELTPVAPRLFRAPLPSLGPGRHPVTLLRRREGEVVSRRGDVIDVSTPVRGSRSAELARRRPDRELLRDVAARTGGRVDPAVEEVLAREDRSRPSRAPLRAPLLAFALVLLLGDVALRRRFS